MDFRATPVNVVMLLLVALAIYVLHFLSKKKFDSNVPLLFFASLIVFTRFTDREVNLYLLLGGIALALILRFEFMNGLFMRLALMLEVLVVLAIAGNFVAEVFDLQYGLPHFRF